MHKITREILFVLLITTSIAGFGQSDVKWLHKFSVGINFSPNFSFHTMKADEDYQIFLETLKKDEKPGFGFNTGISLVYYLTKHIEIESGLQYSQQTYQLKNITIENLEGDSLGKATGKFHYNYFEIPLKINYHIRIQNPDIYATGGLSLNFFHDYWIKSNLKYNDGHEEKRVTEGQTGNINYAIIAIIAGVGIDYDLGQKFNIRFEPLFRYSFQPVYDTPLKLFNYSIGGQFGFLIKL
jgi:hypothetical protein